MDNCPYYGICIHPFSEGRSLLNAVRLIKLLVGCITVHDGYDGGDSLLHERPRFSLNHRWYAESIFPGLSPSCCTLSPLPPEANRFFQLSGNRCPGRHPAFREKIGAMNISYLHNASFFVHTMQCVPCSHAGYYGDFHLTD